MRVSAIPITNYQVNLKSHENSAIVIMHSLTVLQVKVPSVSCRASRLEVVEGVLFLISLSGGAMPGSGAAGLSYQPSQFKRLVKTVASCRRAQ